MKKIFVFVLICILFVVGCSNKNENGINISNIKGYWLQTQNDSSGNITDLTNNKYSYLKITDDKAYFYSYYFDTESYAEASKYYKLEDNKMYYDYNELKGNNWKNNIDSLSGGIFFVSFESENLILTDYFNDKNKDEGYEKNTYIKIDLDNWPIEE
ncbi:MAG: hypothetical protein GX758_01220 [Tenericutes bacterium]|nr:hypothetical protein [Mycoplasmatota bacterium]